MIHGVVKDDTNHVFAAGDTLALDELGRVLEDAEQSAVCAFNFWFEHFC